ncbi:MAG: hypothetical protein JOZ78_07410 [Chroococcidiopsidaceae cyanobacterium CP_BM_ER_R8_30]|nr:hypothetical protein [Chroococcidiopsidaceae cyanobacterium CP_BM_ER_R8_30]
MSDSSAQRLVVSKVWQQPEAIDHLALPLVLNALRHQRFSNLHLYLGTSGISSCSTLYGIKGLATP